MCPRLSAIFLAGGAGIWTYGHGQSKSNESTGGSAY